MSNSVDWKNVHNVAMIRTLAAKFRPSDIARAFGITRNVLAGYYNRIGYYIPDLPTQGSDDVYTYARQVGFKCVALLATDSSLLTTFAGQDASAAAKSLDPFLAMMVPDAGPRPKTGKKIVHRAQAKVKRLKVIKAPLVQSENVVHIPTLVAAKPAVAASQTFVNVNSFGATAIKMEDPVEKKEEPVQVAEVVELVHPDLDEDDAAVPPPSYIVASNDFDYQVEADRRKITSTFPKAKTIDELTITSCRTPLWGARFDDNGRSIPLTSLPAEKRGEYKIKYAIDARSERGTKFYCGESVTPGTSFCSTCLLMLNMTAAQVMQQRREERLIREAQASRFKTMRVKTR